MAPQNEGFRIDGLREFEEALDSLDPKTLQQIYRSANRKVLTKHVKGELSTVVGERKKFMKVASVKEDKTGVKIGPSTDVFWTRFLEKGTKSRSTKSGASRGRIAGNHKIETFYRTKVTSIIDYISENYGEAIDEILEKKVKKVNKKIS